MECTLELPPAVKGETDPLASLRRFLSRQAFSSARAPDELLPLLRQLDQQAASSDMQLLQTKLLYLRCLFDFLDVLSEARPSDTLSGKKARRHDGTSYQKLSRRQFPGRRFPLRICAHSFPESAAA